MGGSMIVWLCGLSGSGKTTIGQALYQAWKQEDPATVLIDGDEIREVLGQDRTDRDYTPSARRAVTARMGAIAGWLERQSINVVVCNISIDPAQLLAHRTQFASYFEVFIDVPVEVLAARDGKGLYRRALQGLERDVVGVDIAYPGPSRPDLVLDNSSFATPPQVWAARIAAAAGITVARLNDAGLPDQQASSDQHASSQRPPYQGTG